jgi:hypothetical protein
VSPIRTLASPALAALAPPALCLAVVCLTAIAGCDGGGPPPIDIDAGCNVPGTAPDQPVIACPSEVDLGCLGPAGAEIDYLYNATACDGSEPAVVCTPADGTIVTPGTTSGSCTATGASGAMAGCTFPIRYRVSGDPAIACAPELSVACTGPLTSAAPEAPAIMESCGGGAVGTPTSDTPAAGFPVGSTTVTWTATVAGGAPLGCTSTVRITDGTPPTITCPTTVAEVVRTSPTDPITAEIPTASDTCDAAVSVSLSPLPTMRGSATITATATDDGGNDATCTFDLDVLDVFAPEGLRVVSAELAGDGSTDVTLGWEPSTGTDVTELRLERADALTGPWTELATLPISTITYTDATMPSPRAYYRIVALAGTTEGGATPPVRALAIASDLYHVRDQTVASVPFPTSLYGVVRHPIDLAGGPYPLVPSSTATTATAVPRPATTTAAR